MTTPPRNTPITVTHIISGDLWAGAEVQVYNLCKALNASEDIAVTAVVFNPGILHDKLNGLGIAVTLADETRIGPLAIAKAIARHCTLQSTDIVHTHGLKENILGIVGKELARVPYSVRTVHGNPEQKLSWKKPHKWIASFLDTWTGRTRQQSVIAVSSQLQRALAHKFPGKVHKIFNFIDVNQLRNDWLRYEAKTSPELRLGIVGRLVNVKRIDLFLKTIFELQRNGISCKGIIIGDGPLKADLKKLSKELGIEDSVEFCGFINPVAEKMRTLDALLMPSDHEGLPMTLLEALALELPVMAHEIGGIPEVLDHGKCGWLVKDHTSHGYSMAIQGSFADENTRKEKQIRGLEHVTKQFDLTENCRRYVEIYSNLCRSS